MYEFVEGASKRGSKGVQRGFKRGFKRGLRPLYYWKKLRKKTKTKTQAIHKQ